MNVRAATKPANRHKLSRAQVAEILERNISLYRDEDQFVSYLVELALYLLEYEYDWEQSTTNPPTFSNRNLEINLAHQLSEEHDGKLVQHQIEPSVSRTKGRICPFCGVDAGDSLVCPSCRNLTR